MNAYTVDPGGRVLWCMRRRTSDVRCVLYAGLSPIEVRVLQDRDLVLREIFTEEWVALNWATEYAAQLKEHGWRDSPDSGAAPAPARAV